MKVSDLFRLLGHLVLYAVEQAGTEGTVTISLVSQNSSNTLSMVAMSNATPSVVPDLYLSNLLSSGPDSSEVSSSLTGLTVPYEIAKKYGTSINAQHELDSRLTLTMVLP